MEMEITGSIFKAMQTQLLYIFFNVLVETGENKNGKENKKTKYAFFVCLFPTAV